jgi:hypothetical protein
MVCLPFVILVVPLRAIRPHGGAQRKFTIKLSVIVTAVSRFRHQRMTMVQCGNVLPDRKANATTEAKQANHAQRTQFQPLPYVHRLFLFALADTASAMVSGCPFLDTRRHAK